MHMHHVLHYGQMQCMCMSICMMCILIGVGPRVGCVEPGSHAAGMVWDPEGPASS